MFYRGRNLDTITAASVIESFSSARVDHAGIYGRLCAGGNVVDKMSEERERDLPDVLDCSWQASRPSLMDRS